MINKILEQLIEFKTKTGRYPKYVNIKRKQYKRLKKELSITEKITENIKLLYCIDFNIVEEN